MKTYFYLVWRQLLTSVQDSEAYFDKVFEVGERLRLLPKEEAFPAITDYFLQDKPPQMVMLMLAAHHLAIDSTSNDPIKIIDVAKVGLRAYRLAKEEFENNSLSSEDLEQAKAMFAPFVRQDEKTQIHARSITTHLGTNYICDDWD